MSTHNIFSSRNKKTIFLILLLSMYDIITVRFTGVSDLISKEKQILLLIGITQAPIRCTGFLTLTC